MARNDSILNTGMRSPIALKVQEERQKQAEDKEKLRNEIEDLAEILNAHIKKEEQEIGNKLAMYVTAETSEEDLKALVLSLRFYQEYLARFSSEIARLTRPSPRRRVLEEITE